MSFQQPGPALVMPPASPPSQRSTIYSSIVSVILATFGTLILVWSFGFPSNAPAEVAIAWLSAIGMWIGVIVLAIVDLTTEYNRKRFHDVTVHYTQMTGDQRFLPYVIKPNLAAVWVLQGAAFAMIVFTTFFALFWGSIISGGY